MAFIQPCFIRKNTPNLRKKLRDLGQQHNSFDNNEYEWLAANYGIFISVSEGFERLPTEDIDCGTNEEMFLALTALRDDTDRYQWFTDGTHWEHSESELPSRYMQMHGHKATAKEIIELFKT